MMSNFIYYTRYATPEKLVGRVVQNEHTPEFITNLMGFISGCRSWMKSFQLPDRF